MLLVLLVLLVGEGVQGLCVGNDCFTVIRKPCDFFTASAWCEKKGGHLMRMRSSVGVDKFAQLLEKVSGSFWIAMHIPKCLQTKQPPQWEGSEWKNEEGPWAEHFHIGCGAQRCVTVSTEEKLGWVQTSCDAHVEGFLCEVHLKDPCHRLGAAPDIISFVTPHDFELELLPSGSTATFLDTQEKFLCSSGEWIHGPWSCDIQNGGCAHRCHVDEHKISSCTCPLGQRVSSENEVTCEEDECAALACSYACQQQGDGLVCVCPQGFQLHANGRTCIDVDECLSAPCEHQCINLRGGYVCQCYEGYSPVALSPDRCDYFCGEDECPATCDPNSPSTCFCPEGYLSEERIDGTFCVEMNECDFDQCDHTCTNTRGSFICHCNHGYRLVDTVHCVKEEEQEDGEREDGSGMTTPTRTPKKSQPPPLPAGGVVAIVMTLVCLLLFLQVLLFLWVNSRRRDGMAKGGEAHSLEQVAES